MAELKIRKGSFLIQVHDHNEVVFAIRVPGVEYEELTKIVIEVEAPGNSDPKNPHPEIEIDIRGKPDNKEQILTWKGVGKGYTGGNPKKKP